VIRLIPRFGQEPADPNSLSDINELIQARIDGRINRRDLIARGVKLGMAAPLIGVMLHATSDYAFGSSSNGRARTSAALRQTGKIVPITGPTQPSGTAVTGESIVCGTYSDLQSLHPYIDWRVASADVYCGIVEPLMKYDSNQQLIPALAEEFEISEDALSYTFKLRQGVSFHNGDPFTAQDVIDSWKMIVNPDFAAFSTLGWDKIADISASDEHTVVLKTTDIYAPFLSYLSENGSSICPSSEIAKGPEKFRQEFGRAPVGTGPFAFVEWKDQESIHLRANPSYWGGAPRLDEVVYRIVPDDNTLLVQIQVGEVQLASSSGALGPMLVDEALAIDDITVFEHETPGWAHLDLKHVDFLRMTKVRQALDFATPSQLIIDQLLKGRATPCVADQAPETWAFNGAIQPRPYDPDQARDLLTQAGLTERDGGWHGPTPAPDAADPNGPATGPSKPIEMEIWGRAGDSLSQQICETIAQSWNGVGIKTEARFEDETTLWGPNGYQFTEKMTACFYSWYNANDPDDSFYWHSSQIPGTPTGNGGNLPAYFHKYNFQDNIDELMTQATGTLDEERRKEIYWQIQELLHDEVPVIFLYWNRQFPVAATNIGGFWPSGYTRLLWNAHEWYFTR
jgi:peptide/nickel transport system substrate-binding protein